MRRSFVARWFEDGEGLVAPARKLGEGLTRSAVRALGAQHDNNPSYHTDLGEALAKHPRGRDEALMILNHLAEKDLLTSAEVGALRE